MKPCCQDLKNRSEPELLDEHLTFTRCTVCGCRHFEAELPPIKVGIKGGSL